MLVQDPAAAFAAKKYAVGEGVRRSATMLVKVATQWLRQKQLVMKTPMKEMTKRLFKKHFRDIGYKKPEIRKRWEDATSDAAFRNKLARKVGGKIWVWVRLPREASADDIVEQVAEGGSEQMMMSGEQRDAILTGDRPMELSADLKEKFSGG